MDNLYILNYVVDAKNVGQEESKGADSEDNKKYIYQKIQ